MHERITQSFGEPVFTDDILDRAEELRDQGLKWREIARILGVKKSSLQTTVSKRKAGVWKGQGELQRDREWYIEMAIMAGWPLKMICHLIGISLPHLFQYIRRLGFTKEEIKEYKESPVDIREDEYEE